MTVNRKPFRGQVEAYAVKLEFTRASDGMAHPHIHAQIWMPDPPSEVDIMWCWQLAAELDYLPYVYADTDSYDGTPEGWLSYMSKSTFHVTEDIVNDPPFLLAGIQALEDCRQTFDVGGLFKPRMLAKLSRAQATGGCPG